MCSKNMVKLELTGSADVTVGNIIISRKDDFIYPYSSTKSCRLLAQRRE